MFFKFPGARSFALLQFIQPGTGILDFSCPGANFCTLHCVQEPGILASWPVAKSFALLQLLQGGIEIPNIIGVFTIDDDAIATSSTRTTTNAIEVNLFVPEIQCKTIKEFF